MSSKLTARRGSLRSTILLVLLVAVGALLWLNQQALSDWARAYGYHPTADVSKLATDDTFTSEAQHLYTINRSTVVPKTSFTQHCSSQQEQTIVLGCYHGVQRGIYILKISDDSRLQGVEQVTAAHEMLHAAYDRLSSKERTQVDSWLTDYFQHDLSDERIKQTIATYQKSEPNDVVNEMHSIFGSEVASLPAPLEQYYTRYFTDRSKVTDYATSYQAEFTSRQQKVESYDAQLKTLKAVIASNEESINAQSASLQDQAAELSTLRRDGQTAAYNSRVAGFNRSVDEYNALARRVKDEIAQYNQLVETRNQLASEQQQLTRELSGNDLSTYSKQ